jgi:hypothetical protein
MRIFLLAMLIGLTLAQDESLLNMTSKSGLNYDEIMEWSDEIWTQVEAGEIAPPDAQAMFKEETGMSVMDFLVGAGRFKIAS